MTRTGGGDACRRFILFSTGATIMKLIATDLVYLSGAGRIEAGAEFEVGQIEGEELVARGIAVVAGEAKAAPPASNKRAPKSANKSA
jgi:hypothetical protein